MAQIVCAPRKVLKKKEQEMQNQKGLTLIEGLVITVVVALLLAVLMPQLAHVSRYAQREVCRTNLKGLSAAVSVYGNDYEQAFPLQGGHGTPPWTTGTEGWADPHKDWATAEGITVGASLYLLVREVDVSPRSFVCPSGGQTAFEGQNPDNLNFVELWDFGQWAHDLFKNPDDGTGSAHGPKIHVSYAYHMPYGPNGGPGEFAPGTKDPAAFAVMADKSPWFDPKLKTGEPALEDWFDYVNAMTSYKGRRASKQWQVLQANAYPHGREGQNVLYADGHASFEKTPDVGINRDNIYTRQAEGGSEEAIRIGDPDEMPTYTIDNKFQPRNETDSFLVNDDSRLAPYGRQ